MDPSTTRTRAGAVRALAAVGAAILLSAVLPAGVASASAGRTLEVGPGERFTTIQDAVDAARSGDTIRIAPGDYHEAVCIRGKGLTIRGAGTDVTNVVWPQWRTAADLPEPPEPPDGQQERHRCWEEQERVDGGLADTGLADTGLADDVSGLFFLEPDGPVRVSGLTTRHHPAGGIVAWGADGLSVTGTSGHAHGRYGIVALDSTNVRISDNHESGLDRSREPARPDSGTAGISVGDSGNAAARISGNHVEGYDVGILLREVRGGRVAGNTLSGNCIGLLLRDDVATQVPDGSRDVAGGAFRITGNFATDNDRYCLQGRKGDQRVSGVGMQVVDADDVTITGNVIADNTAVLPAGVPTLTDPAGGLTLIGLPEVTPPPGRGANAGPVEDVWVTGNYFGDNVSLVPVGTPPAGSMALEMDVFVGNASVRPLEAGEELQFRGNRCDAGLPTHVCGAPYPAS